MYRIDFIVLNLQGHINVVPWFINHVINTTLLRSCWLSHLIETLGLQLVQTSKGSLW